MNDERTTTASRRVLVVVAVVVLVMGLAACGDDDGTGRDVGETPDADGTAPDGDIGGTAGRSWSERSAAPRPATEVGAAWFDGRIWVVGGVPPPHASPLDAVQVYDPADDSWSTGAPLPVSVHHATVVATDDSLVVVGGFGGGGFGEPTDTVWTLTSGADGWSPGPPLPSPRGAGAGAWDGGRVVFGGGVGPDGLSAEVWALSDDGWAPVGELSEARDHLGATSDGEGRVWFLGGRLGSLESNRATVDLVENGQVTAIGALPTPRGGVAGFHSPEHGACLAGGEEPGGTLAAVECIDGDGQTTTLAPLGAARHGLGAVVADGVAYTLLGGPEPGLVVSDVVEALPLG